MENVLGLYYEYTEDNKQLKQKCLLVDFMTLKTDSYVFVKNCFK